MSILKLKPSCKDYIWGGSRLKEEYEKEYDGNVLAETWELSCHPDGPSYIANGEYAGKTLQQYIDAEGKEVLGTNCRRFRDFPILTKFIDAKDNLSIQVHPDNRYALKNEGQYGKTEMWYVMDAGKDAFLYYGFKREITKEEFEKRIKEDTLLEVLNAVPVQKGDVLFIESRTIHAIGKDILIAEIQQNSNVTYRVYDYGRIGKDGRKRDLHIEKALAVTNRVPIMKDKSSYPHIADCDYFTVDKLNLDGKVMKKMEGNVSEESFASILILDGKGTISDAKEELDFKKGDSFFLSAGEGNYTIEGICDALVTTIREKAAPVRIGIDIGGTDTKIGLVDIHQKIIVCEKMKTDASRSPEEIIREIGQKTLELLERQGIAIDQCVGAGIGVPGTIDRKNGIVRY
ncbi:MAG: ROK family protein, partial [Lachnospiraceae bacterium]|nr:ROK family protein [Lachnospiraceae bacterium]